MENRLSKPIKTIVYMSTTLLFVIIILNLFYGWLLYGPRLRCIVPASSIQIQKKLQEEDVSIDILKKKISDSYMDINRYLNTLKSKGNILHSTSLGVFYKDNKMYDYMHAHQQYCEPLISVDSTLQNQEISISELILTDVYYANQIFSEALQSKNPIRWRKMVEAELLLSEVKSILNQEVGARIYGRSLTYQYLFAENK